MKKISLFIILVSAVLLSNAQSKLFVSSTNFLQTIAEPEVIAKDGTIQLQFIIDAEFSSSDVYKDSISLDGIEGRIYHKGGATPFQIKNYKISTEEESKVITVVYTIKPNIGNIETDWSNIDYKWNLSYAGQKHPFAPLGYKNKNYNKGIKPKVSKFFKSAATDEKNVNISITTDAPGIEVTNISIVDQGGSLLGEVSTKGITKKDNQTFETVIPPVDGFSFLIGKAYKVDISYKSSAGGVTTSRVIIEDQKLDGKEDFKILNVTGMQVIDNNKGLITVQTSAEPENLNATLETSNGKPLLTVIGVRENNVTYKFPIKSEEPTFDYGVYKVSFLGNSKLTGASLNSSVYTFEKKKPTLIKITAKNKKDSFLVTAVFDTAFAFSNKDSVRLQIERKSFEMKTQNNKTYTLDFTMKDLILKETLSSINKDREVIELSILYPGNSKSTIVELPVTILDNIKLETLAQADKPKKRRREDIEAYLSQKDFVGDTEKVATAMVEEFGKSKESRDWDKVWNSVVKLAPKVLGALTLLL